MKTLLALCLLLPFQLAQAVERLDYVILRQGKVAGHKTLVKGDDGVYRSDFFYKDNGRGPELKEEFTLRPDGTFERFKVTGKTTFGSSVDEHFVRTGDHVEWRSTSDHGELDVPGGPCTGHWTAPTKLSWPSASSPTNRMGGWR